MNAPVDAGMLKGHDGPEGQTVEVSHPVAADLADVIDWLAAQFIRSPQKEQVHAARSVVGQMLLREMGEVLGNEALMARLGQHLSEGTEEEVTVALLVEMDWVAPFCRAMARLDGEGYYGVMAEVLPAALARVSIGYGTGQEE